MTRYAHSSSKIAAALLALTAACGSGQPAQGTGNKFLRMQNPAELDSENGLIAIGLGVALLAETVAAGGGSTGYVLGVLFVALGCGRLYLLRRR